MFSINTAKNIKNIVKQHPIIATLIVGIPIRILTMPTTLTYDSDFWAIVIRNLETGTGLYHIDGYYYTPVWGYVLAIITIIQSTFLNLGELGVKFVEALPVEVPGMFISATIPSIEFLYSLKIPLMVVDLGLAYLTRVLILDVTKDKKKANIGFALMFLCPSCIASSMCIAMPDGISAFFLILMIILVRRDQLFLAGMCYAISILNKFFPVFLFFIIFAYLLMKSKSDVKASRKYLFFMAGGIITSVIIFLPQILRGELTSCFQFLTDRSGFGIEKSLPESLEGYARILFYSISILLSVWMARDICKKPTENLFDKFMGYCLTVLGLCFIFPSTTQYLVVMVPFIVYHIAVKSKRFMKCWLLIGVGGSLMTYSSVTAPLLPLGFNTDFFSGHWMVETFTAVTKPIISQFLIFQSLSIYSILSFISLIIQCIGVALVLWINLDRHYRNKEEKFQ